MTRLRAHPNSPSEDLPAGADWKKPYRSRDEGVSAESAGRVGWDWINELAIDEQERDPAGLLIETPGRSGRGTTIALYRDTELIAVAHIFRDPMNFYVLIRWKIGDSSTRTGEGE